MANKLAREESKGSQAEYKRSVAEMNARAGLSKNPKFGKDVKPVGDYDVLKELEEPPKPRLGGRPNYNPQAVQKEINKDKRIGGKEAAAKRALLKGRAKDETFRVFDSGEVVEVGDSELKDFVIKVRRPQTTRAVELTFTAATPADASLAAKKQGFLLLSDPVLKRMANDAAFSAYGVVKDRRLLKEFATKAEAEKWAASEPGSKVTKITVPGRDVRPVGDVQQSINLKTASTEKLREMLQRYRDMTRKYGTGAGGGVGAVVEAINNELKSRQNR